MNKDLKELQRIGKKYREVLGERSQVTHCWYAWNYWADRQDWYFDWAYENGLKAPDLAAKRATGANFYIPKNNKPEEIAKAQEEGIALYRLRHLLWRELDQLRLDRSIVLQRLWRDGVKRAEIASAYYGKPASDRDVRALDQLLRKEQWFKARVEWQRTTG